MSKRDKTIQKRIANNKEFMLEQLKRLPIVQVASEKAGISRATYYRWRKDDVEFAKLADEAIFAGVQLVNDMAESQLLTSIKNNHMTGIIFWLKHRHKAYSTKVELSGSIKTDDGKLTPEQEELVQKAINLVFDKELKDVKTIKE